MKHTPIATLHSAISLIFRASRQLEVFESLFLGANRLSLIRMLYLILYIKNGVRCFSQCYIIIHTKFGLHVYGELHLI